MLIIVRGREREFQVPTAVSPPDTPNGNAVSERLAYVSYASGFTGGAGGVVHLVSAGNTVSKLKSDDWIMLSRNVFGDPGTTADDYSVHRWYRVVSAADEAEVFQPVSDTELVSSPNSIPLPSPSPNSRVSMGKTVWRQKVVLDGPDWSFGYSGSGDAGTSYSANTFATIVEGVVSVTERVVLLRNL